MDYQRTINNHQATSTDTYCNFRSTVQSVGNIPEAAGSIGHFNQQQQQHLTSASLMTSHSVSNGPAEVGLGHFNRQKQYPKPTTLMASQHQPTSSTLMTSQYNNAPNNVKCDNFALFSSNNWPRPDDVESLHARSINAAAVMQPDDHGESSSSKDGTLPASGDCDDDDDDDEDQEVLPATANEKEKRAFARRTVFTRPQLRAMEERFVRQSFLSREERIDLGEELKLTERQIMIWFQNRRGRYKKRGPADKAYQHKQVNDLKWTWNLNRPTTIQKLPSNGQCSSSYPPAAGTTKCNAAQNVFIQPSLIPSHQMTSNITEQCQQPSLHNRLNNRTVERGYARDQQIASNNAHYRNDAGRSAVGTAVIPDVVNTALNSMQSDYYNHLPQSSRQQELSFQNTTQQLHLSKNISHQGLFTQNAAEQKLYPQMTSQFRSLNERVSNFHGFNSHELAEPEYYSPHPTRLDSFTQNPNQCGNFSQNPVQQTSMPLNPAQYEYLPQTSANEKFVPANITKHGQFAQISKKHGCMSQIPTQQSFVSDNSLKFGYLSQMPSDQGFFADCSVQQGWFSQNSFQSTSHNKLVPLYGGDNNSSNNVQLCAKSIDNFDQNTSYYNSLAQANDLPMPPRMMQSPGMFGRNDVTDYVEMRSKVAQSSVNMRGSYVNGAELQNNSTIAWFNNL